jgi:hypothetical protein
VTIVALRNEGVIAILSQDKEIAINRYKAINLVMQYEHPSTVAIRFRREQNIIVKKLDK